MQSSLPRPWRSSAWLISLLLAGVSSALPARAVDDGHGGAASSIAESPWPVITTL